MSACLAPVELDGSKEYLWDMDWSHSLASKGFPVKAHEPRVVLYIICATLQRAKTLGWVVREQAF